MSPDYLRLILKWLSCILESYHHILKNEYYIKCKLNPVEKQRLREGIKAGSLAKGKIFYQGMQTALREGTIDENDIVHFVEICYCLEGGLYPMAMEIPTLKEYFDNIIELRHVQVTNEIIYYYFYLMLLSIIANSKPNWNAVEVKHLH